LPAATLIPVELAGELERTIPRPWILEAIYDWLAGPDRYFVLSGGPGTGKTTMACLALSSAMREGDTVEWAASHFCSNRLSGYSLHPRQFANRLHSSLASRYPQAFLQSHGAGTPLMSLNSTVSAESIAGSATGIQLNISELNIVSRSVSDYFEAAIVEPLTTLAEMAPQQQVRIVVDGLDEAVTYTGTSIVSLLQEFASAVPRNCRVLLTTQNYASIIDPFRRSARDLVHLDLSDPRHRQRVKADVQELAVATLAREDIGEPGRRDDLSAAVAGMAGGNFLQAAGLLREAAGGAEDLTTGGASDMDDYYLGIFQRLQSATGPSADEAMSRRLRVLHTLAILPYPISISQLAYLLDWETSKVATVLSEIQVLLEPSPTHARVRLEHPAVNRFLLAPTLSRYRVNPYGVAEADVQESTVARLVRGLASSAPSTSPRPYPLAALAFHLKRLRELDGARAGRYLTRERLFLLARSIATGPADLPDPAAALSAVLDVSDDPPILTVVCLAAAESSSPALRSVVVDALQRAAKRDQRTTERIVKAILSTDNTNSWTTGLATILRLDAAVRQRLIAWVATTASPQVRAFAGYLLYTLSGGNAKLLASEMLNAVVDTISVVHPRRTRRVLEFLSNVSITAYTNNCDDPDLAVATSDLWREVTVNRLHFSAFNRPLLERPLVSITAEQLAGRIAGNPILASELGLLDDEQKSLVRELTPALTPAVSLRSVVEPLRRGFDSPGWLVRILSGCVLAIQAVVDFDSSRPAMEELFEAGAGPSRLWQLTSMAVLIRATPPAWVDHLEALQRRLWAENAGTVNAHAASGDFGMHLFTVPLPLALAKAGRPGIEHVEYFLERSEHAAQRALIEGVTVAGLYYPHFALETLGALRRGARRDALRDLALSRIHFMHPTLVDLFVQESSVDLRTTPREHREIGFAWSHIDVLGLYNNAVHQAIHYPRMRNTLLQGAFLDLAESRDVKDFVKAYAPRVLKLLRDTDYQLTEWMA
jgi:hypothetical protein